jgi:hypothetical protein
MPRYAPAIEDRPYPWPILIREGEYERIWKPAGWRLIVIGPTATWREEWGMWEAIRDIVQNCLDEAEGYSFGYDSDGLWIADRGKGVAVADFLLGPPKLKPDWARGKFGEGMKIAALAILRQGYPVYVETVKRELWMVFVEQEVNGKVKSLAALWKPNGTQTGTRFHILGYNGSAYERNFAVNLPRSLILAEVPSPITKPRQRYNQLIRAAGPAAGGIIYCRDIYLSDITSPFSYNLWGFELAPDRHGPNKEDEMWGDAGRLWSGVTKMPLLAEFLGLVIEPPIMRTAETLHIHMNFMGRDPIKKRRYEEIMQDNAKLWQEAWNRTVGKDTVLRQDGGLDSMVTHLGYRSVSAQWGVREALGNVIKTDKELVREMTERLSDAETIPDKQLIPQQLANLELARAIAKDFSAGLVSAAIIPPASDMIGRTAGIYEFDTHAIKVHAEMLHKAGDTIGVMVHELGHHMAYMRTHSKEAAGDLTPEHAKSMEYVSGRIFFKLSQGVYDEYLKRVAW